MVAGLSPGETPGEDEIAALLAPPARWGYEYVRPPSFTPSPEREHAPQREQVRLIPRARAAGLWEATGLVAGGSVFAIVLDASFGVFSGGTQSTFATIAVLLVHTIAAAIAFFAARAWFRAAKEGSGATASAVLRRWGIPGLNAAATFLAPYLVLPAETIRGFRRIRRERGDLVPHPGDTRRIEEAYADAMAAWQQRIAQFEQAERRRLATLSIWRPVAFARDARVTCVFGGPPLAWTAALTTLGGSLLGSNARVLIGDLSRRLTVDVLAGLARAAGIPVTASVLPSPAAGGGLLAEIDWPELSSILVEVLHSAQRDLDVSRRERQDDRSVIREVSACLDPRAPVSIARLRAALLAVQEVPLDGAAPISPAEHDRLRSVFNEVQRTHGGVLERVIRIERALRDFELLDGAVSAPGDGVVVADGETHLRVIGIDKRIDELENDRLVDLLFQLLLRRVRAGSVQADVLVVLGADRIRREALEALIDHAGRASFAVVLMFEHLRQDAIELIGAGGAAAAFMALGNHREAKEASEFIGSEYKWVESAHTASASRSLTQTRGAARGTSLSGTVGFPPGVSISAGARRERSYSEAFGRAVEYAATEERVREGMIEPELLMALPLTGMILVEVLPGGSREVTNIDCHPSIALSSRAAREA